MDNKEKKFDFTQWARDFMDPIFDPLLSLFVRAGVTPNTLTVIGTLGHFLAVWLLSQGRVTAAGLSLLLIAPLDAMDGALARKIGQTDSIFGAFLDSTLDRLSEIILFGGIIYYFYLSDEWLYQMLAYIAITGSLLTSYLRAKAEVLGLNGRAGLFGRLERYLVIVNLMILGQLRLIVIIVAALSWLTVGQRFVSIYRQIHLENHASESS